MSRPAEFFIETPISPIIEMGAYEHLWLQPKASFKTIAELFAKGPGSIPSDFVSIEDARIAADQALQIIKQSGDPNIGIRVHGALQYPKKIRDAVHPVELLYYRGAWELAEVRKSVAVVGSRKPSQEGIDQTQALVSQLVEHGYIIVSGLAAGIDRAAHMAAIEADGRTISVVGTPITDNYPKENRDLQELIATNHLLISQVPILRYRQQNWRTNRFFFPERNKTMSALTQATIIVEAGETSGTLIQARAALQQGRQLFILNSCFENPAISWPQKYAEKGAIRVYDIDDIKWGLDVAV